MSFALYTSKHLHEHFKRVIEVLFLFVFFTVTIWGPCICHESVSFFVCLLSFSLLLDNSTFWHKKSNKRKVIEGNNEKNDANNSHNECFFAYITPSSNPRNKAANGIKKNNARFRKWMKNVSNRYFYTCYVQRATLVSISFFSFSMLSVSVSRTHACSCSIAVSALILAFHVHSQIN